MKKLFQLLIFLLPISVNANDDYVDLGLPSGLLWATCNLGAESPEQYGNYYDWDKNPVQEYWRGSWRTPTKEECDELVYNCMRSVETINGIKGARYTGSNGNSIFFPFAGYYQKGAGPYKVGEGGQYWTITPYNDKEHWILATNHSIQADDNAYYWPLTYFSFPVRPVISRNLSENVIVINKENFPDDNFRTYLNKQTYGQDGIITEEEIGNILYIEVHDNISNLKGIEYFKALKLLNCSNNHLTNIDVSKNTALTSLNCYHNQLTSIDISKNTALTAFWCSENQLTNLDVSKNTKLDTLVCTYNQLTDLDCSNNTALTSLWCNANYLTRLDVSKSYALTSLDCHANKLTILDVSKNVALIRLDCYKNQLTSLDVSKNTMLTWLSCYNNQLTNLDVSKNIALTFLSCSNNQLVNLDISNNTALTSLSCDNNQLINLDISNNTALTSLSCDNNQLTNLDVSNNIALTSLSCDNNQLTNLDVSNNTALTSIECFNNQIKNEAMFALVNSLQKHYNAQLYVIDQYNLSEGNICTTTHVNIAKQKQWRVMNKDGQDYEGSDPMAIQTIFGGRDINASVYDLNGRKLKDPRKGINIIGGKKVYKK